MATRYCQLRTPRPHRRLVHTVLGLLGKCGTGLPYPVIDTLFRRFLILLQIIDPHDLGIAESILLNLAPDERLWDPETLLASSGCVDRTQESTQAYFEYISGLQTKCARVPRNVVDDQSLTILFRNQELLPPIRFVNTSMHGVSSPFVKRGMEVFGFPEQAVVEVAEQKDPDPEFPTVVFPNPEEKG